MASVQIPLNFLKDKYPDACLRQLDFTQTSPSIPAFKDHFAAIVDNILTLEECQQLLRLAEESTLQNKESTAPAWHRAMVNVGNGRQDLAIDRRNCGRILWDTPEIADRLLCRLRPFIKECGIETVMDQPLVTGHGPVRRQETFHLSRLNERLRFLRYEGGEYFRPHWDGNYVTQDGAEISLFTVHLYLNGTGEQDVGELERKIEESERRTGLLKEDGEVDPSSIEPERDCHHAVRVSLLDQGSNGAKIGQDTVGGNSREPLLGGATSFTDGYGYKEAVRVFPKAGSVLIFQQRGLFHGGDDVFRGVKYTVRTDVMYRREAQE